jgi:hypothetical protein
MWRIVDVAGPHFLHADNQGFLEHEVSRIYGVEAVSFYLACWGHVCLLCKPCPVFLGMVTAVGEMCLYFVAVLYSCSCCAISEVALFPELFHYCFLKSKKFCGCYDLVMWM